MDTLSLSPAAALDAQRDRVASDRRAIAMYTRRELTADGVCYECFGELLHGQRLAMDLDARTATHVQCAPIKVCSCCGMTHTAEQWDALPLVGVQRYPWGEVHELRNCACHSTLALVLEPGVPS